MNAIPVPTVGQLVSTLWSDELPLDLLLRSSGTPQAQACVSILRAAEEPLLSLPPKAAEALVEHLTSMCQNLLDLAEEDPDGEPGSQAAPRAAPGLK